MLDRPSSIGYCALLVVVGTAVRCGPAVAVVPWNPHVFVNVSVPGGLLRSHADGPNLTLVRVDREQALVILSNDDAPDTEPGSWFANIAVRNFGNRATFAPVEVAIFVDGALARSWVIAGSIAAAETVRNPHIAVGRLSAGTHKIRVVIDPSNRIEESMETDNEFEASVTVPPLS